VPLSELPWGYNRLLLTKPEGPAIRLWYARKAIEHGWSRAVLAHHIETQLHKSEGKSSYELSTHLAPAAVRPGRDFCYPCVRVSRCVNSHLKICPRFAALPKICSQKRAVLIR
jgi:hypothetical protein